MTNEHTEAERNYQQMETKRKNKMIKYMQQQMRKHPDVAVVDIHEKVARKFNVKFVQ